ncbi:MAG TPA: MMPL family transporter [Gaiellaceae bacterium]|nr:MMPL family transporter [Gaiellaceae bacterium]
MGSTERLARASASRPRRTFALWGVAVLAALALIVTSLHGLSSNSHVVGKPESTKASDAIARAFPQVAARQKQDVIVVSSQRNQVTSPQFRAFGERLAADLRATGHVRNLQPVAVSPDRRSALVSLTITSDSGAAPVEQVVEKASGGGFQAGITGYRSSNHDFGKQSQTDLEKGELAFGLPAALVVLVLVFGAVVAGLVPVLMAILSIIVALGLVTLLSLEFSLSIFIVNMLTGMGLALGIDYSLFVVSRYREERALGLAKEDAIAHAGATASRAVLFSGSTFVVALIGMFIVPTSIMRSLALGAILVGIVSVAAALTLLPALLSVVGDGVNKLRVPILGRNLGRSGAAEGRFWRRIVEAVLRRPAISLAVSVAAILAAASPIFGLHIGANGVSTLPSSLPSKQGYVLLQRSFPAQNPEPVRIVAVGGKPAAVHGALVELDRRLTASGKFGRGAIQTSSRDSVALLTSPVRGDPVGGAAVKAVRDLRAHVIPSIFRDSEAQVYVGGDTAENVDYFDAVTNPTPYVLLFVLGLSFILLTIAFRSIVVALVSVLLNLLSVGAAYGLLTLVFLYGDGASLFGFQHTHVIDAWVPLFLFSVLFGLSMDYQVFLMSRIKERYDTSGSTHEAVAGGVASTARIITGAALIIVVVFAGFAAGKLVMFQQMGFGVAVALLIDATVIRSVVLPSMLGLLDRHSWYLPRWLDWLPHVEVERPPEADVLTT